MKLGNNIYKDYENNKMLSAPVGSMLTKNRFFKPNAGITSITTKCDTHQENAGAIIYATVNFTVFNLFDFENIFMKYFFDH